MKKISLGKTEVTIHSGYNEIGGNLIEIRYGRNKIILDLGLSFQRYKKYYEWPSRLPKDIDELMKLNIVPPLKHLFKEGGDEYDAILITHAHRDHSDLMQYIENNTPIYIGETSKLILDTKEEVYNNYKYKKDLEQQIVTFRTTFEENIDHIHVKAIHVDHSIPGAYCFFIETPDTNILYTGDYRLHGGRICERSLTMDMIDTANEYGEIDLFITEGTRFNDCTTEREIDVLQRLNQVFSNFKDPILLEYSYLDIDRYESIIEAALNWEKKIIFWYKHFIFLYNLYKEDPKLRDKINLENYKDMIHVYIKKIKNPKRSIKEKIDEIKDKYIVIHNLTDLDLNNTIFGGFDQYIQEIYKLTPDRCIAIHSTSEPYDEELELSYERISNWLKALNAPSYRIHSSGHIHPVDLIKVYRSIKPRETVVIHSEYSEQIRKLLIKSV